MGIVDAHRHPLHCEQRSKEASFSHMPKRPDFTAVGRLRRKSINISSSFPNLGADEICGICVSAAEHRVTVCLVSNRERTLMRWFFVVMLCGGAGLWLSAQYQVPQWLLWLLLALGTTVWGLAKWMEQQEAETEHDQDRRC